MNCSHFDFYQSFHGTRKKSEDLHVLRSQELSSVCLRELFLSAEMYATTHIKHDSEGI
jgi:hypothetical protein